MEGAVQEAAETKSPNVVVKGANGKFQSTKPKEPTHCKIVIDEQAGVAGVDDVHLMHNGKAWIIQRGKEVVVPIYIYRLLLDCVQIHYVKKLNPLTGTEEDVEKPVPRFAMRLIGYET
jgi:hypothetical protein